MNTSQSTNISRSATIQRSSNSSTTTSSSNAKVFLHNLKVLGFEEAIHCKGTQVKLNEQVFLIGADNTKAFQLISHFLFHQLDKNKTKILTKNCWPVNSIEKSRLYMKLALGWLQDLKRSVTVLKHITLRKSNFNNCRGEIMNEIFMAFSTYVLEQVNIRKGAASKPFKSMNKETLEKEIQKAAIQLNKKEAEFNSAKRSWSEQARSISSGLLANNATGASKRQKTDAGPEALAHLVSRTLPQLRKTAQFVKNKEFEQVERQIRQEYERKAEIERQETLRLKAQKEKKCQEREEYERRKQQELVRKEAERKEREREEAESKTRQALEIAEKNRQEALKREEEERKRHKLEIADAERRRQILQAEIIKKKRQETEERKVAELKIRQEAEYKRQAELLERERAEPENALNLQRQELRRLEQAKLQREASQHRRKNDFNNTQPIAQPTSKATSSNFSPHKPYNSMETRQRLWEILNTTTAEINTLYTLPPLSKSAEPSVEEQSLHLAPPPKQQQLQLKSTLASREESTATATSTYQTRPALSSRYKMNHTTSSSDQSSLAVTSSLPEQNYRTADENADTASPTGAIAPQASIKGKRIKRGFSPPSNTNTLQENTPHFRSPKRQALSPVRSHGYLNYRQSSTTRITPERDAIVLSPLQPNHNPAASPTASPSRSYVNYTTRLSASDQVRSSPRIIKPAYLRSPRRATPFRDSSIEASSPNRSTNNTPASQGLLTPSHFGLKVVYSPSPSPTRLQSPKRNIVFSPPRHPFNRTTAANHEEEDDDDNLYLDGLQSVRPIDLEERPLTYDATETPARYQYRTHFSSDNFDLYKYTPMK